MADLAEIMGTVMASLTRARKMADEESIAVAEFYSQNDLLKGLTIPRIRIPEMTLDIPVVIEEEAEEKPLELESPNVVADKLSRELTDLSRSSNIELPNTTLSAFKAKVKSGIKRFNEGHASNRIADRGAAARIVEKALLESLQTTATSRSITPENQRRLLQSLSSSTRKIIEKRAARPSIIRSTVLTNAVKERSSPENVTRIKLTLREEGLDWAISENPDGSSSRQLIPE